MLAPLVSESVPTAGVSAHWIVSLVLSRVAVNVVVAPPTITAAITGLMVREAGVGETTSDAGGEELPPTHPAP